MSNLDYPISLLVAESAKISSALNLTGKEQVKRMNQFTGIVRAVNILSEEKKKEEIKERERKEKLDIIDF